MKHKSVIKKRDLAIGTFFTQINMTFNKVLYSCVAAFLAYGEWRSVFVDTFSTIEIVLLIYLFCFYLVLILTFVFVFGVALSVFTPMLKKGVLGEHNFEFLDQGFTESTEYNESFHKYNSVSKIFSRLGAVYIGVGGMHWHILPKRDFRTNDERLDLVNFLKEKINA